MGAERTDGNNGDAPPFNSTAALARLYGLTCDRIEDVLDYALEEALHLSMSTVGYIYFYSEKTRLFTLYSWSSSVMSSCTIIEKKTTYALEKTGLWGEVVRSRSPIVVNDFQAQNPLKKGYPAGHVNLLRFMSVPIISSNEIVAVVGVGNKPAPYSKNDVDVLNVFSQGVWSIVSRLQAEEELKSDRDLSRIKYVTDMIPMPLCIAGLDGHYKWCNDAMVKFLGVSREDFIGKVPQDFHDPSDAILLAKYGKDVLAGRGSQPVPVQIVARGGEKRSIITTKSIFKDSGGRLVGLLETFTDITHAKRLEEALSTQAEFTNMILEHAPVGIAVYDAASGHCLRANRYLADLLGGSVKKLQGQNFRKLGTWEASGRRELAERALSSRAVVKADKRYHSSFGKEVFLECTFASMEVGEAIYLLRVDKDISGRKRLEAELQEQLLFIQTLVDAIPSPVFFKDTDGRYVWWNKAYKEHSGTDELTGKTVLELQGYSAAAIHAEKEAFIYAQGVPVSYESTSVNVRGEEKQVIFNKAPVIGPDGSIKGLIGVLTDITERKHAEEMLRENEEVLRKILVGIQAGIVIVAPESFTIEDINPVAEMILGRSKADLVGKPCNAIKWIREQDGAAYDACPLLEGNIVNEEFRVEREDDVVVPILKTVISAKRSGRLRFYEVIFDMTARKKLERQLVLAQRLESIGSLAAGIAHEINTPIQYIGDNLSFLEGAFLTLAEAVRANHAADDPSECEALAFILEEMPKALEQSREGVSRVAEIVKAMKRFAHPGGEERSLLDVPKAIENVILISRNEWKYHSEIRLDLDPAAQFLSCYLGDFNQVLINIVVNASHAINDKYKESEEKGIITIKTSLEPDTFVLSVSDTGCGIPEKHLHRVFDPFFTTKEVGKGTGQGLALVHDVMKKHGGSVDVASVEGQGATFVLRFPMSGDMRERK